jgi:hypothetical protein
MGVDLTVAATALNRLREKFQGLSTEMIMRAEDCSPFLKSAEAEKKQDGEGRGFVYPFAYAQGNGVSADLDTAITKSRASGAGSAKSFDRWVVPSANIASIYATGTILDQALQAAKNSGAVELVNLVKTEMDDRRDNGIRSKLEWQVPMGEGWGALAQVISVNASPAYIVVAEEFQSRFPRYMDLVASTAEELAVLAASGANRRVTGSEPGTVAGTWRILLDEDPTTGSWAAANSFVFAEGDRQDSATPTRRCLTGHNAWVPGTARTGAWYGVTITGDPELQGRRVSLAGLGAIQAIARVRNILAHAKKKFGPDCLIYTSQNDYDTLWQIKEAQKNVEIRLGKWEIEFTDGLSLGGAKILPDSNFPDGTIHAGPFMNAKLRPRIVYTTDDFITVTTNPQSGEYLFQSVQSSKNVWEFRMESRLQYVLPYPGAYVIGTGFLT